jgi:hypothetical protein
VPRAHDTRRPRGAALPLALILLAVLTAIAVAAVSLSSQERVNAASYSRIDFVTECATAAQAKVWSELASLGTPYLGQQIAITEVRLPDGSVLAAPAHYDTKPGTYVSDVIIAGEANSGLGQGSDLRERDVTNTTYVRQDTGRALRVMARCYDHRGRMLELELSLKFAM